MHMADTSQVNSIFELLMKGGIIMIPIILLSFISIYIFIERYIYIKKSAAPRNSLVNKILSEAAGRRYESALADARKDSSAFGRIFENGLIHAGKPAKEVEGYMESAANLEIALMEKDMGYLGIIAGVAPMLGFIGTIAGVIKIFYNISLADNISIGIIAGGLYQKMICSGVGLIVGVIAYSAYHYLQMMIDRFTVKLQRDVSEFLKTL
ncbi:MAG TPA: MotA/TolQ/ExbB proton channel family protein [Bacteroidales bacterium]|nr:MotA/TolQ/ExbB proton channel family protein [Bacteroidales bacterium]